MSQQTHQQPHQTHPQQKIVTVFGATGKQGGAIVCALLKQGHYKVRGVARRDDENKLKRLKDAGVEIVKANIATGEGLDQAFKGAYATFLVTASFDNDIEGKEYDCGRRLVDKARANGVEVLVWSTLPHVQKISCGKFNVPHFTEKAKVEEYIRSLQQTKVAFSSAIFIAPSFYYQNFHAKGFYPKKNEAGTYVFEFPKVHTLTACDITDLGPLFVKLLENAHHYDGKIVLLEGEQAPPQDFIEKFQKVTGQKAILKLVSNEEWEKCPELHHSKQLAEMFAFMNEYTFFGQEKLQTAVQHAREIYPQVKNWETYLRETGWKGEHKHP